MNIYIPKDHATQHYNTTQHKTPQNLIADTQNTPKNKNEKQQNNNTMALPH